MTCECKRSVQYQEWMDPLHSVHVPCSAQHKHMTYIFPETMIVKRLPLKSHSRCCAPERQPIKMIASGAVLPEGNPFRHSCRKKSKGMLDRASISLFPPNPSAFFCYQALPCPKTCSQQLRKRTFTSQWPSQHTFASLSLVSKMAVKPSNENEQVATQ